MAHCTTCFGLTRPISGTCIKKNEKIMYNTITVMGKAEISFHHKNI